MRGRSLMQVLLISTDLPAREPSIADLRASPRSSSEMIPAAWRKTKCGVLLESSWSNPRWQRAVNLLIIGARPSHSRVFVYIRGRD